MLAYDIARWSLIPWLLALAHGCGTTDVGAPPTGTGGVPSHDASNLPPRPDATGDATESSEVTVSTPDVATDAAAGDESATTDARSERDVGAACEGGMPPMPMGATIDVRPPSTLASALSSARPGDRIVLHAGAYTSERITSRTFSDFVFVEAASNESITLPGIRFDKSDHVAFKGIRFAGTVMLDGSSYFTFQNTTFDGGAGENAALQIHGQSAAGASHDILVESSRILGGGRTIFVLGAFAPSDGWNHRLTFLRNDITCGSHNCFQISGGRDISIADNKINGATTTGVLTAGATRVSIVRNRFHAMGTGAPAAVQLATPGAEWDNYAGVENMISSAIVVANNVIDGWANGIQLDAATNVAIVYDTVAGGAGVRLNHRTPHDQSGKVILDGNADIRVWNDILPSISVATGEMRPTFESHNLVGGTPGFAAGTDFMLDPTSPAVDAALVNAETPVFDFDNHLRGDRPDIGARELGATAIHCESAR